MCVCPEGFPAGFYWYGGGRRGPGRPPKWVDKLLQTGASQNSLVLTQPEHELSSTRDGPENEDSTVESPTVSVQDQMGVVIDEDTTPAQHTGDEVDEARDDNENAHLPMDNVTPNVTPNKDSEARPQGDTTTVYIEDNDHKSRIEIPAGEVHCEDHHSSSSNMGPRSRRRLRTVLTLYHSNYVPVVTLSSLRTSPHTLFIYTAHAQC